jgi:excisionase family DNA binding protein
MAAVALVMSEEQLEAAISRAVEPLRRELAEIRRGFSEERILVTQPEAAARLHLGLRTIQRMVAAGEIPSTVVRGRRRLDISGHLPAEE